MYQPVEIALQFCTYNDLAPKCLVIGNLSTRPHLSSRLALFLPPESAGVPLKETVPLEGEAEVSDSCAFSGENLTRIAARLIKLFLREFLLLDSLFPF